MKAGSQTGWEAGDSKGGTVHMQGLLMIWMTVPNHNWAFYQSKSQYDIHTRSTLTAFYEYKILHILDSSVAVPQL